MNKLFSIILAISIGLVSCQSGYNESHKDIFSDQVWSKGEVINFKPLIHDAAQPKSIKMALQHIYGYDINGFDILVKITSPSGKEELSKTYYVKFKEDNGTVLSQCSGDYCDIEQVLEPNYQFQETGEYSISFEQHTSSESVAGFLSLKLNIDDLK